MPVVKQKQYQPETKQKENKMPQVGKKKFPYTSAGMKDAKEAAKKSGKKMPDGKMMAGEKHGTSVAKKGVKKVSKKMY